MQYKVIELNSNHFYVSVSDGKEEKSFKTVNNGSVNLLLDMANILNVLGRDGWKPIQMSAHSDVFGDAEDISTAGIVYIIVAKE